MAKLNKFETEQVAKDLARRDPEVLKKTVDQVRAADYRTLQDEARELARLALFDKGGDLYTRYPDAFLEAYTSAVQNVWYGLTRNQDNARKSWQRALNGLTTDEAKNKLVDLVKSFQLRGLKRPEDMGRYDGLTVEVERAWGVSATLYVRFERDEEKTVNPDDATQTAGTYHVRTELSWSATTRTLAEASASVKLYGELVEVAAEVEAVMKGERVVWTWGVPEKVEVPVEPQTVEA